MMSPRDADSREPFGSDTALDRDMAPHSPQTRNPRRMWTAVEDEKLKAMVQRYGDARGSRSLWKIISMSCPGRTAKDCRKRWFHSLHPSLRKGRWAHQEDRVLLAAYARLGPAWHDVALMIPGRTDDQCSKRYNEILDPSATTRLRQWTPEEDRILTQGVMALGHRWSTISARLNNRPPLTCRNHWRHLCDRGQSTLTPSQSEVPGLSLCLDTAESPGPGSSGGDGDPHSTTSNLDAVFSPDVDRYDSFVDFPPLSPVTESLLSAGLPDLEMIEWPGLDLQPMPIGELEALSTDYEITTDSQPSATPGTLPPFVESSELSTGAPWSRNESAQANTNGTVTTSHHRLPESSSTPGILISGPLASCVSAPLHLHNCHWTNMAEYIAIENEPEMAIDHGPSHIDLVQHHHYYHHHHHHHHRHHHHHHSDSHISEPMSSLRTDLGHEDMAILGSRGAPADRG
ncbi:hypothetical protein FZEAL_4080 [Fusarium zealandicum]|uniref:Uncharacterized protein n=1 Tax=Fusarium zealandicum TaxID=1053134 RepID=A0A8H4XM95_9HYPO|nr:hypothetical protein FZEAL_4080 [Fusarium zealandicum]